MNPPRLYLSRIGVGVDIGLVGDVVAGALEEADERELGDLRQVGVVGGRTVGRLQRPLVERPVEGDVVVPDAGEVRVQAAPAPAVVGLICVGRNGVEDRRVAVGVASRTISGAYVSPCGAISLSR